jgi:DNA-directed RNA polymerase specialized sigma24 family protein
VLGYVTQDTSLFVARKKDLPYDPSRSDSGVLAGDLSYEDTYFKIESEADDSSALVLDTLLQDLPERQRAAIEMCILGQISYAQAGRMMGCSDQTMRRETLRALAVLKQRLEDVPWLAAILDRSYLPADPAAGQELPEIK